MSDQRWAQISLCVAGDRLTEAEIAAAVGVPGEAPGARVWVVGLTADSSVCLEDQLADAERFLGEHADAIAALEGAEMRLRVSWTPRRPQDSFALTAGLIALVARLGGEIDFDALADD